MTVNVENNTLEFDANWTEGSSNNKKSFTVSGSKGFRYEVSEGDWFDVTLTGNTFTVTVRENFNIGERNGYILINNNMVHGNIDDDDTIDELEVDIHQNGMVCTLTMNISKKEPSSISTEVKENKINIAFSLIPSTKETIKIGITTNGGIKDFIIKDIREEFVKESTETIEEQIGSHVIQRVVRFHKTVEFDHGIKTEKLDSKNLKITSYGCVFPKNDIDNAKQYIITIAHKSNREITNEICVSYKF